MRHVQAHIAQLKLLKKFHLFTKPDFEAEIAHPKKKMRKI